MNRTRSGKTLTEKVTMLFVLLGLSGMLAYSVQKVCAASLTPSHGGPGGAVVKVSLKGSQR